MVYSLNLEWVYLQWGYLSPRSGHICLEGFCTTLIPVIWPSCTSKTFFLLKSQVEINFITVSLSREAKFLSSKYDPSEHPKLYGCYFNFPAHRAYNLIFCLSLVIMSEITGVLNLKHTLLSSLHYTQWQFLCLPFWFSAHSFFLVPEDFVLFCKISYRFENLSCIIWICLDLFQMGGLSARIGIIGSLFWGEGGLSYAIWEEENGLD